MDPLSGNSKSERHAQSRGDATIGVGMRVEGNIAFTGVLHVQGEVLGDICCGADPNGTLVVGTSGNVTGKIESPHIVVSGRISGPLHSSESIEIQPGAHVAGDAFYQRIDIHAGGIIEGSLIPAARANGEPPAREGRMQGPQPAAARHATPGDAGGGKAPGRWRVGAAALLIAVAAIMLARREPTPQADVVAKTEPAPPAPQAIPAASTAPQDAPKAAPAEPVAAAPSPGKDNESAAPSAPANPPEPNSGNVVLVQGVNPAKPAGVILLISREPSVLFKKKRQDSGEGARIETSQGATESIAIARNEILRVASGQDLQIFYQGRKVAPRIIASGAWMSFVPQTSGAANENK